MKKALSILFLLCALALCGCQRYETVEGIDFPFAQSDIASIEAYYYSGIPAFAEKKTVTDEETLHYLYDRLSSYTMQTGPVEYKLGASVSGYRFHLTDGTAFEVVYEGYGVKDGLLHFPALDKTYHTRADVNSTWFHLTGEAVPAEESELPSTPNVERALDAKEPTAYEIIP